MADETFTVDDARKELRELRARRLAVEKKVRALLKRKIMDARIALGESTDLSDTLDAIRALIDER